MHALIIEDDALIALLIEMILREQGFATFDVVVDARSAVAAARHRPPDLITSDVELYRSNGIDAVGEMRFGNAVPVIFITACPDEVRARLPEAVVLTKPFQAQELTALIVGGMESRS